MDGLINEVLYYHVTVGYITVVTLSYHSDLFG